MRLPNRKDVRAAMLRVLPQSYLIAQGDAKARHVYLTFDDGPDPELTPRLLDRLSEHRIRATFFVVGQAAERHPDVVVRIHREGHALGTHSWSHAPAEQTDASVLARETHQTRQLVHDLTGYWTNLCRPPYGAVSASKLLRLWCKRQSVVLWSHDVRDYECGSREELMKRLQVNPITAGDIVLLHDRIHPTVDCLDFIAERLDQIGCRGENLHHAGIS